MIKYAKESWLSIIILFPRVPRFKTLVSYLEHLALTNQTNLGQTMKRHAGVVAGPEIRTVKAISLNVALLLE